MLFPSSSGVSISAAFQSYQKYFFLPVNKTLLLIVWKICQVALCSVAICSHSRSTKSGIAGVLCIFKFSNKLSVYGKNLLFVSAACSGQAHFQFSYLLRSVTGIGRICHMIQA